MNHRVMAGAIAASLAFVSPALAADPEGCRTIRMFDPGWTDITSTNAIAGTLLTALGYAPDIKTLSVPIGYQSFKNKEIDVFLGNWMPAQQKFIDDLTAAEAIEVVTKNLEGAKFTLAVPTYVAEAGVKDFADLSPNADKFGREIYGIEPGAPANQNMTKMIASGDFGLTGWSVVESGEQAMLAQVKRAERSKDWIVFLAWAPHPMNTRFDITYLSGGDAYFGPNYGGAEVYTLAQTGWTAKCPNAAGFFKNLVFDIDAENAMMDLILNEGAEPEAAAKTWLTAHPDQVATWLDGVTTLSGEPGLPAVKEALGM